MTSPLINYFFTILNMSYTACFVVGAVLLARLLLNWLHAPKIFSYALWAVVLFRLLCPISFESALSPLPSAEVISPQVVEQRLPQIHSGIALIDEPLNAHWQNSYYEGVTQPASQMQHWAGLAAGVWLAGAALLLGQSLLALRRLHRQLRQAKPLPAAGSNVWQLDGLPTAFVLGLWRPRIYLPAGLSDTERQYILLHEQAHLRRGDHLLKLLAFAALLLHWFNPLVWLAFRLGVQDMEMACDEAVLRRLSPKAGPEYSAALLHLANSGRPQAMAPLAFSEGDVKSRIKNALSYRKPALWIILVCLLLVATLLFLLWGNPNKQSFTVEELSENFIEQRVNELQLAVSDREITRLEQLAQFDDLLEGTPLQIWALEYRLKIVDINKINLMDYLEKDGWIVESVNLGRHLLVIGQVNDEPKLLGQLDLLQANDSLSALESNTRQLLEQQELLPQETYPGNHAVVQFSLSDGEICQLLLSQPARQGADGIWCVERWLQGNGNLYYVYPEADVSAREYYAALQAQCDEGHQPWLLEPLEVAAEYIRQDLSQNSVGLEQLTLLENASLDDFYNLPNN